MPRTDSPNLHRSFQAFLQRVSRPIEFASRQAYAHLAMVKNLDRFVSEQVLEVLGERVYPRALETNLLLLRSLFVGFHTGLSSQEQQDRLSQALVLLRHLQKEPGESPTSFSPSEPDVPVRPTMGRPLWDLPIQFAKGVGPKRAGLLERWSSMRSPLSLKRSKRNSLAVTDLKWRSRGWKRLKRVLGSRS